MLFACKAKNAIKSGCKKKGIASSPAVNSAKMKIVLRRLLIACLGG
jgi:hypothetical protein